MIPTLKMNVSTTPSMNLDINNAGINQGSSGNTYIYTQPSAKNIWVISHNMNKYPSVTVVDSAGSVVVGEVVYNNTNQITITFIGSFSGKAYLN